MNPDDLIGWLEPWPAIDRDGNACVADIELRASAKDCVNMQRRNYFGCS